MLTAVVMKDSMIVGVFYVEKTQDGNFAYLAHYYHGHMMCTLGDVVMLIAGRPVSK